MRSEQAVCIALLLCTLSLNSKDSIIGGVWGVLALWWFGVSAYRRWNDK